MTFLFKVLEQILLKRNTFPTRPPIHYEKTVHHLGCRTGCGADATSLTDGGSPGGTWY
jgi:hypothetical protein